MWEGPYQIDNTSCGCFVSLSNVYNKIIKIFLSSKHPEVESSPNQDLFGSILCSMFVQYEGETINNMCCLSGFLRSEQFDC